MWINADNPAKSHRYGQKSRRRKGSVPTSLPHSPMRLKNTSSETVRLRNPVLDSGDAKIH